MPLPAALLPWVELRFLKLDEDGLLVQNSGGFVSFFEAGTTTPQDTYSDPDLTTPVVNANPIELDADGRSPTPIYFAPASYKVVVKDSDSVTLYTYDNVSDPAYTFYSLLANQLCEGSRGVVSGYEITVDDNTVTVDEPVTDPAIINLQPAADRGQILVIQNVGATDVDITPNGSETINVEATEFTLPAAASPVFPTVMLFSDGISDYRVVAGWGL